MLLDEVGTYLEAQGLVGGATGWTAAKAWMPPSPDKVVALFESAGEAPLIPVDVDVPVLQVRVRGDKFGFAAARQKLQEIQNALHAFSGTLSGTYFAGILAVSGAQPIGQDTNDRPEITQNFRCFRTR